MKQLNMKKHGMPGMLITFCGLDGCGKTTLIRRLAAELERRGQEVFLTKQPTDFVRNADIFRTYMDKPNHDAYEYRSLSLLAAGDRVQHANKVVLPALKAGKAVLCDRYFYSCLANLHARGYEADQWIYEIAESVAAPDAAFFLDVPVETAVLRVRSRPVEKFRYIDMELQYKLREKYIEICKANGGILLSTERPLQETYERILEEVNKIKEGIK